MKAFVGVACLALGWWRGYVLADTVPDAAAPPPLGDTTSSGNILMRLRGKAFTKVLYHEQREDTGSENDENESPEVSEETPRDKRFHLFSPSKTHVDTESITYPLPIYWINLDQSAERRVYMEERFAKLALDVEDLNETRVPATDKRQVQQLLATGRFVAKGVRIVPANSETQDWEKHKQKEYTEIEAATLLSHLNAILLAYKAGHEYALILEDDAVLTPTFLSHWKSYADLAPSDWNVLQWSTNNEVVGEATSNFENDPWVSWVPDHYSTTGYLVSRKGMEEILVQTFSQDIDGKPLWRIEEPEMVVADEAVFYLAKKSYTSTVAWIGTSGLISTHDEGHFTFSIDLDHPEKGSEMKIFSRPERVLVVMTCRIKNESSIPNELKRLKMDTESLSKWHPTSRWLVNVVAINEDLKTLFIAMASDLPESIDLHVHVNEKTFNKFSFLEATLQEFNLYDYVLFKDNDMRLTGFPWNTFMERKGDAMVSGPLHEAIEESLARHIYLPKRNWYQFYEAQLWKRYRVPEFEQVLPVPTMYIEHSFALIKADFAHWFFEQALTPWFLEQPTDWGIDKMWCGAAKSFRPELRACELVPVVAVHDDTRQLVGGEEYLKQGRLLTARLRGNDRFRPWLDAIVDWETFIEGNADLTVIYQRCKDLIKSDMANLTKCANLIVDGEVDTSEPVVS